MEDAADGTTHSTLELNSVYICRLLCEIEKPALLFVKRELHVFHGSPSSTFGTIRTWGEEKVFVSVTPMATLGKY